MSQDQVLESVVEHHTDMLMVEELKCDPAFAAWFAEKCGLSPLPVTYVRNSVWDSSRESDVLVHFGGNSGCAVLIENKVTASLSLNQAEDYRRRGEARIENGQTSAYRTCIFAPSAWLRLHTEHGFDVAVTYEDIAEAIERSSGTRPQWRASVFRQGASRAARKLTFSDEQVASFLRMYYAFAQKHYPELGTSRSTGLRLLIVVYPLGLEKALQLGRYVDVQHNIPEQRMKITIGRCSKADAEAALGTLEH